MCAEELGQAKSTKSARGVTCPRGFAVFVKKFVGFGAEDAFARSTRFYSIAPKPAGLNEVIRCAGECGAGNFGVGFGLDLTKTSFVWSAWYMNQNNCYLHSCLSEEKPSTR